MSILDFLASFFVLDNEAVAEPDELDDQPPENIQVQIDILTEDEPPGFFRDSTGPSK